jgi:hypothetical protein
MIFQCQGATICKPEKILADLNETFQAAMCYVILSRIMCINQLMLLDFDQSKIYCNELAKQEAVQLRERAINRLNTEWNTPSQQVIKISTLNIRSLRKHAADLKNDDFLGHSDIITLTETWLDSDPSEQFGKYSTFCINKGSKGIAVLSSLIPISVKKCEDREATILVTKYEQFNLISVYRPPDYHNIEEFTNDIQNCLDFSKSMIICGDFNYNLLKQPRNQFSTRLEKIGFQQIVTDSTHIKGGLLDHVYFFSPNSMTCKLFKIHPVYYSDHDAVTFILHLGDESSGSQD